MYYKNNWLTWYYDDVEYGPKTTPSSKFDIKIKPTITRQVKSYKEELLLNASLIRDSFNEPFDLMLSGGVDSEVILRCYHELKIPVNVFVFRYENNYNLPDVTSALRICNELNVTPKVIDFNLQKFFENDAHNIWATGYYLNSGRLPHMKMIEYLDNIPIMGDSPPYWKFVNGEWKFELAEIDFSQLVYCKTVSRTMIADWYEYSPELILAHVNHPIMQILMRNQGLHEDFIQAKYILHKDLWNAIELRPKYVGFEGRLPPGLNSSKPAFMLEFNKLYNDHRSSTSFYYSKQELINALYALNNS
jgi:hypothetical protein